jgi:hypothetical protein
MQRIFDKLGRYFGCGWRLAVLDLQKGRWILTPAASKIDYLKAENAKGRHILMQPVEASCYFLADDLSWPFVCKDHRNPDGSWKPGRLVVETSPQNFQVWIHSHRRLSLVEKRYWLQKMQSDAGADPNNRWGRCPGFRNRKDKHRNPAGHYPLARLVWIDWLKKAQIPPRLLNAPPINAKPISPPPPKGGVCHCKKQISRADFDQGNESATDFSYALALTRRGYSEDQIRYRLFTERTAWQNHRGSRRIERYLERTIKRAKVTVVETQAG